MMHYTIGYPSKMISDVHYDAKTKHKTWQNFAATPSIEVVHQINIKLKAAMVWSLDIVIWQSHNNEDSKES